MRCSYLQVRSLCRRLTSRLTRSSVAACIVIGLANGAIIPENFAQDAADAPAASVNSPNHAAADGENLDALLDLADKAPERLQSIGVKESHQTTGGGTESLFNPDTTTSAQATSTGGLLSNAPGVVVRSTSALNQDVRLRGYSGSQLVGVADGMNQMKTRLDIDSLFSQIDPNLVESVTVISGPYAVEYGPGFAFFDAQLIAPKRAEQLTFSSESIFGFTTNGQQLMWRETAGYANQYSGAIFSVGQRMGNDYRPGANAPDFKVPASYHVQDVYLALSNDVTEYSRFDFGYLGQGLRDTELPGVAYDINHQRADQFNFRWTIIDDDQADRLRTQFWWNQAAFDADASRSAKQRTFVERLLGEPYPEMAGGGTMTGRGLSDNWGARSMLLWGDDESAKLRTGIDWRRLRQFYSERDFQPDGTPAIGGDVFGIPDSSADDFGLFVGGNVALTERWTAGFGQRLDWVRYGVDAFDEVAVTTQVTPNGTFSPGFDSSTRFLTTSYLTSGLQVTETLTLNAGVAFAMRPPNLTELYADQPFAPLVRFGNSFAMGNSGLDPEQNLQFDLGFTSKHEQTTFGARAFHSNIHNYIGLAGNNYASFPLIGVAAPGTLGRGRPYMSDPSIPNQDLNADSASIGYSYRNLDRVTLSGFDLVAEHQVFPWLELGGTLTYVRGINHDPTWVDVYTGQVNDLPGSEGLPGIYPLSGILTTRLIEPLDRNWSVEWQSRFAAQQDYLAYSLGEIGTPGFFVHNIHASYRWRERLTLRSSLLNVFDRNYYEHNSLAIVDRNGNIGFVRNPGLAWFISAEYRF